MISFYYWSDTTIDGKERCFFSADDEVSDKLLKMRDYTDSTGRKAWSILSGEPQYLVPLDGIQDVLDGKIWRKSQPFYLVLTNSLLNTLRFRSQLV